VVSVFHGADEELFCETWSPTYPFTALHLADASADVVRAAAELTDVPVRVVVPGEVRREELGLALGHAGLVLGSFRESRAIPAAVFDALATGAPVITADTEAARELLQDGDSALLVEPEEPAALAGAIERLASDTELRGRIAARGRDVFTERASRPVLGARWRDLVTGLR
jgi:glycosyltransferase involved in cell wall biosynthesis